MLDSPVAVGITDGQNPDVIRFALAEAVRLDCALRVIHVVENHSRENAFLEDLGHDLDDLVAVVPIERVTLFGDVARVLLAESGAACRLVVGTDSSSSTLARGAEIAQQIALHATVPVVVVPMAAAPQLNSANVLVGVDDAQPVDGQMAYAIEAAEQRGVGLEVVFAAGATSDYPGRQLHWNRLEDIADRWRVSHPSVPIHVSVEGGHAVESCLAAGTHASLMVLGRPLSKHPRVGSRSVATQIMRHSKIPVAVVPVNYSSSAGPAVPVDAAL